MASQFYVQYLDSSNKLVQKNISSNSASELEREIVDKGGEVLSVVEKKNTNINIQIGDPVKLQEKTPVSLRLSVIGLPLSISLIILSTAEI